MSQGRAILKVTAGPNQGDTISLEVGACRLIGRHLSENETIFIDNEGNRVLDASASVILSEHLQDRSPSAKTKTAFSATAFERGPDVIFADDAISRAHAMVFHDASGVGIIDLASTNGTYINSERTNSSMLADGDTITLGSSELRIRLRK